MLHQTVHLSVDPHFEVRTTTRLTLLAPTVPIHVVPSIFRVIPAFCATFVAQNTEITRKISSVVNNMELSMTYFHFVLQNKRNMQMIWGIPGAMYTVPPHIKSKDMLQETAAELKQLTESFCMQNCLQREHSRLSRLCYQINPSKPPCPLEARQMCR